MDLNQLCKRAFTWQHPALNLMLLWSASFVFLHLIGSPGLLGIPPWLSVKLVHDLLRVYYQRRHVGTVDCWIMAGLRGKMQDFFFFSRKEKPRMRSTARTHSCKTVPTSPFKGDLGNSAAISVSRCARSHRRTAAGKSLDVLFPSRKTRYCSIDWISAECYISTFKEFINL